MEGDKKREVQQSRCSSLLPLHSPEDGSRASSRNVVILISNIFNILLFGRWIKSINPSPHSFKNVLSDIVLGMAELVVFLA
jgi:hypothetical protein